MPSVRSHQAPFTTWTTCPRDLYDDSFTELNSLVSPWHQWLDRTRYDRHVDAVEALQPSTVASAHGPILTGAAIHDAFDRVRSLAGQARVVPPSQSALDELLAHAIEPRAHRSIDACA